METSFRRLSSSSLSSITPNGDFDPEKDLSSLNAVLLTNSDEYGLHKDIFGVYPSIPINVAQYVNQQNPDLCAKVADVLRKSGGTNEQQQKSVARSLSNLSPSPLRSLANTSDALALQHSVIGNTKIKPVPPEMVASVVEKTRKKLSVKNDNLVRDHPLSNTLSSPGDFSSDQLPIKELNGVLFNEILRYPSESITATIEKRSWIGPSQPSDISSSSSSSSPARAATANKKRHNSQSSTTSSISSKQNQKLSSIPATHHSRKVSDDVFSKLENERRGTCVLDTEKKEFGSSVSDIGDLESSFSESYDTESAFSGISGIEEEMFNVKKLLLDVSEKSDIEKALASTSATQTERHVENAHRVCDQATETDTTDDFQILRQKMVLEGELETLKRELDSVLRDNNQYQTLAVSLEAQLNTSKSVQVQLKLEKEAMSLEIEKVEREKQQWKNIIDEYQSVIDTKSSEIKSLKEDIAATETNNEKLKITYEELKIDMESKDGAVQGLKRKIAELHVELQTLLQGKIQLQNDLKSMEAEKTTLQKSKEWYQEQLHSVQESRNKVHQNLISHQTAHTTVVSVADRLQVENMHLKQQLSDMQQKAMKEKEMLMKHLENIEADMLEREAMFQNMKKGDEPTKEAISDRLRKMEEEQSKVTNLTFKVSDLEHQLESAKKMLADSEKGFKTMEGKCTELTKRVTLIQKSFNDQIVISQQFEQQKLDLQSKLNYVEVELRLKEDQMLALKTEKTAIEVALAAANSEKRSVSDALIVVKENLNKVEVKFNLMRTELVNKASQLEQLLREKQRLEDSLQQMEEQLFQQKRSIELQKSIDHLQQSATNSQHQYKNEQMDGILSTLKKDLQENEVIRFRLLEENEALKEALTNSKQTIEDLKIYELENKHLKKHSSLQKASRFNSNSLCSNYETCIHIDHIENLLQASEQHHREKTRVYESNIKVLTRKLKEVFKESKRKEKLMNDLQNRFVPLVAQKDGEKSLLSSVSVQTDATKTEDQNSLTDLEKIVQVYKEKLNKQEKDLSEALLRLEEQNALLQKNQEVILNLEKEKGQLKGFQESNSKLRQHVAELEGILAKKESDVSELGQQTQGLRDKQIEERVKIHDHLKSLEQDLANEKALVKELRHQVFQEKRDHSHLKRQVDNLKNSLNQAGQLADMRQQDILKLQGELEMKHQAELKHRSEMESLYTECKRLASELKRTQKELEEMQARDPALAQQIKTLSWHLKEKNQEISSMKEHLQLSEEKYKTEIEGYKKQIQGMQNETEELRTELISTRKEKFGLQAKVSDLRGALKSSVDLNKKLQRERNSLSEQGTGGLPLPESPAPYDEKFINSLLQQSLVLPQSRPLSNLQACLNALKQEMSVFQQQLQEHTNT